MSNIAELEASLHDMFGSFDMSDIDDSANLDLAHGEVREIRTDLTILASARSSGN